MRPEMLAFYERMARGGTGLIIVESPTVDYPAGARWRQRYRIDDDRFIEGLKELADVIHKHGCPTFMQMNHDGPWQVDLPTSSPTRSSPGRPSALLRCRCRIPTDFHNEVPKELTIPEIEDLVDKFASAARSGPRRRASTAWTSTPRAATCCTTSSRPSGTGATDIYGGSEREPLPLPVPGDPGDQAALRQGLRLHDDHQRARGRPGGGHRRQHDAHPADRPARTPAGSRRPGPTPSWCAATGSATTWPAISPTCSSTPSRPSRWRSSPRSTTPRSKGAGANIAPRRRHQERGLHPGHGGGQARRRPRREDPRGGHGRLHRHDQAPPRRPGLREQGAARAASTTSRPAPAATTAWAPSAAASTRSSAPPTPTSRRPPKKKKVLVIGGGPGGMEAARVSALRGHDVTLYEKQTKLGGLLPIAAIVKGPHPEDVPLIVEYLDRPDPQAGRQGGHRQRGRRGDGRADEARRGLPGHRRHRHHPQDQGHRPPERGERRRPAQEAQVLHPLLHRPTRCARSPSSTCRHRQERRRHRRGAAGLRAGRVPGQAGPQRDHRRARRTCWATGWSTPCSSAS